MNAKKLIILSVLTIFSSVFLFALVGARGSFGFGQGSVFAFGSVDGRYDKNGIVALDVSKHPGDSNLWVLATCQNQGGNQAPGINPIQIPINMSATADVSNLSKSRGSVDIAPYQLRASLTSGQLAQYINAETVCPNGNWTVVDAYPVGFTAVVDVKDRETDVIQSFKYVCGVTIDQYNNGASPFSGNDRGFNEYRCNEQ